MASGFNGSLLFQVEALTCLCGVFSGFIYLFPILKSHFVIWQRDMHCNFCLHWAPVSNLSSHFPDAGVVFGNPTKSKFVLFWVLTISKKSINSSKSEWGMVSGFQNDCKSPEIKVNTACFHMQGGLCITECKLPQTCLCQLRLWSSLRRKKPSQHFYFSNKATLVPEDLNLISGWLPFCLIFKSPLFGWTPASRN